MLVRHGPGGDGHEARQPRLGRERVVVRVVEPAVGDAEANREQLPFGVEQEPELGFFDEIVGQSRQTLAAFDQFFGQPPRVVDGLPRLVRRVALGDLVQGAIAERHEPREAGDLGRRMQDAGRLQARHPAGEPLELELPGREDGRGPFEPQRGLGQRRGQRLGRRGVEQRFLEIVKEDADGLDAFLELREQSAPLEHSRRPPREVRTQAAELALQGARRAAAVERVHLRLEQADGIVEALEHAAVDDRCGLGKQRQTRAERQEVAREVAAVDRRDIGGRQRRERARVVPIVEVPAIPLHAQQRVERRLEPIEDAGVAEISEIAGGHRRQELQSDVGRRRPVGDDVLAILLVVVGDQPMVARPDQLLEEAPRAACDQTELAPLALAELCLAMRQRQSREIDDHRRDEPQDENRARQQQALVGDDGHERRDADCHDRCLPHPPRHSRQRGVAVLGAIRRDPLEETAASHQHANHGPGDCVEHDDALMREEHGREDRLTQAREHRVALGAQMFAQRHSRHVAAERSRQLDVGRERQHEDHDGRPQGRRSGQHRPSRHQQQHERRAESGCAAGCRESSSARSPAAYWVRSGRSRSGPSATATARSASRRAPIGVDVRNRRDSWPGSRRPDRCQ